MILFWVKPFFRLENNTEKCTKFSYVFHADKCMMTLKSVMYIEHS